MIIYGLKQARDISLPHTDMLHYLHLWRTFPHCHTPHYALASTPTSHTFLVSHSGGSWVASCEDPSWNVTSGLLTAWCRCGLIVVLVWKGV